MAQDQNPSERVEQAMFIYEDVRLVLERLREIDTELDARELAQYGVTERAKEHLSIASDALTQLADLMRHMQMRPQSDSSDGPLDAS